MMSARKFDVIVYGATGFTGKLVCEHLTRDYEGRVRWAIAGRNRAKLEEVKRSMVKLDPKCENTVDVIVADSSDPAALKHMAAQTRVVIATAGPFARHGTPVVEAALQGGAHYCDITGEVTWVRRSIDAHHEAAKAKGVKIVHCCGYDSLPSDLGALVAVEHARKALDKGVSHVWTLVQAGSAAVSGGTIASVFNMIENESSGEMRAVMGDAYVLAPRDFKKGTDQPAPFLPAWNPLAAQWQAPWFMEGVNGRVVHRSAALRAEAGTPYGADFKYTETLGVPTLLAAVTTTAAIAAIGLVVALPPLRALSKRVLPAPGEGPTRKQMLAGHWRHRVIAATEEPAGREPQVVEVCCADPARDPGYWGTSRMVLEAALALALQEAECAAATGTRGGVLTPATAMGAVAVKRLQDAGLRFDIVRTPAPAAAGAAAAAAAPAAISR